MTPAAKQIVTRCIKLIGNSFPSRGSVAQNPLARTDKAFPWGLYAILCLKNPKTSLKGLAPGEKRGYGDEWDQDDSNDDPPRSRTDDSSLARSRRHGGRRLLPRRLSVHPRAARSP